MCAVKSNLKADDISRDVIRKQIMSGIRARIPLGMDHHTELQDDALMPQGHDIDKLHVVSRQYVSARRQVGTLGGGNHFIELQKDDEGYLWLMLHSGSRNLGKQVGDYYNQFAKKLNSIMYTKVEPEWQMHFLPIGVKEFTDYWKEMSYCVDFAFCNRKLMMDRIQEIIADALPQVVFEPMINIAHNYAAWEHHYGENVIVHRKGAVRARAGEVGIIPGSQGTSSYIVEGLGCPEAFMSSSHGAGRVMSRKEAIRTLSLEKEKEMLDSKGIIHGIRSVNHLDEAASAYKDIDEVMANQTDLVKILTRLSPIAVIKG
jgi:tRNA-splicing ligase RtcB